MHPSVLVVSLLVLTIAAAAAEPPMRARTERAPSGKALSSKPTAGADACASYGVGFARVEGTTTCAKVGGWADVGVGTSIRR